MSKQLRKKSNWTQNNEDELELSDVRAFSDDTSLIASPNRRLAPKKLKQNRVGSPPFSNNDSTYESSASLSPVTKFAFLIKDNNGTSSANTSHRSSNTKKSIEVDNKTVPTPSGQDTRSKHSDKSSYREQIRNRFLSVKKNAGVSSSSSKHSQADKTKKNSEDLKKKEIKLVKEDEILTQELSKSRENTLLAAKLMEKIIADDFFCKSDFEEEKLSVEIQNDDEDVIIESPSGKKQTVIDLLNLDNTDDIITFEKPLVIDLKNYDQHLTLKPDEKIDNSESNDENLRDLEEEGLYVGSRPKIFQKKLNTLQKRLISTKNRKWFENDGQLKILPDPRREMLVKPTVNNLSDSKFDTIFNFPLKFSTTMYNASQEEKQIYILKIHLLKLKFHHHPLFTPEHFFAQRLKHLYAEYKSRQINTKHMQPENKLAMLRQAKAKIELQISENNGSITERQKQRLNQYRTEITKTRELRCQEFEFNRQLLKRILNTWKNLKQIREKQKYINTAINVSIKKERCDYEEEKTEWDRQIELETTEIYEEKNNEYRNALEKFKIEYKQWKLKRIDLKPDRPIKDFTIHSIKNEVKETFLKCFKPPGEPQIFVEINYNKEITNDINFPREKARRSAVDKTKLQLRILFDDKEVHKTDTIQLNDIFMCHLNQIIPIECYSIPSEIKIRIQEQYRGSNIKWSYKDIILSPPSLDVILENARKHKCEFNFDQKIVYSHTGIGAGHDFQTVFSSYSLESVENCDNIFLSGTLALYLGWCNTNMVYTNAQRENVKSELNLDPQDPQNCELVNYLQTKTDLLDGNENLFRLTADEDLFCTDDDIDDNPRFLMLKLRAAGELEFQGQVVPNREIEIHPDMFQAYERRKAQEIEEYCLEEDTSNYQIDVQRQWGIRQINQIRKRISEICKTADSSYTLRDILIDDETPDIGSLSLTFMKWFQPKRPLRPIRKTIQTTTAIQSNHSAEMKIVVNIVQAFHVPIRRAALQEITSISPTKKSPNDIFNLIPVQPFVTVTFDKTTVSTTTAEGSNPTWNQELILNIRRNLNEQHKDNYIYINLFDEQLIDILEDDRLRQSDIHQRRQFQWLAALKLPISIVHQMNRIEGTFEMDSPSIIMGYERQTYTKDDAIDLSPRYSSKHRDSTYLSLFLTLIPPLANGGQILQDNKLQCNEVSSLEKHIRNWYKEFNELFPLRQFPILIKDTNCKTCCITRFLKSLNPPEFNTNSEDLNDSERMQYFCSRYVSLIPFYNDPAHFSGVWLTADQLIKIQIGSIADHAILLQCYFMFLNLKSWLAFGDCLHYGLTAFILLEDRMENKKTKTYSIFNTVTGYKYDVRDTFNPFKRIFCLINHENIWANMQHEDRVHLIRYDLNKSADWLPLFTKDISVPTISFQPAQLEYFEKMDIHLLQERIETKLKMKIMKWRRHMRTVWNRHAGTIFKQILLYLEEDRLLGVTGGFDISKNQNLMLDVQTIMNTYKVFGFPLNMAYTNIKTITDAVHRTNIQNNDTTNMEFALGVYLHQYTGGVISVWLYIATLVRRR